MYDQYGSSRKTTPSKPSNANQQAAASMGSVGIGGIGGRTTTSAAQSIQDKFTRETQRDSGSTYDEVPQTIKTGLGGTRRVPKKPDEEKSTYEKVKETVVGLFNFFGGDEPKDVKTKSGNIYTGPMFAGYTPDTSGFRDLYTEKVPLPKIFEDAGMRLTRSLNDVSPVLPSIDNPALNMFGVQRRFARDPDPLVSQATMEQPATAVGSPDNYANIKSGVDDVLLNLAEDYTIEAGDTLSEIAEDRGTTVEVLQQLNDIPDSEKDTIFAGDKLKVPPKDAENIIRVSTRGTSAEDQLRSPTDIVKPKIRPKSVEVKAVQSALTKLGYDPNGVDGVIGGGTQRAIRKFQKQNGLPVTGEMTEDTKSAILSDDAPSYFDPPKRDAEVIDFSESDFYIFKEAVAEKESGNRYNIRGGANNHYLGKYQMGKAALSDVGINYNNTSNKKFLDNPEQQEKAFKEYTEKNHKKLTQESQAYREMTPKEKLAVLGYAHNQGATAAVEFLFTGVSGKDAFGTEGKEYINLVTDAFSRNQPIPRPQLRPLGRP